MNDLWGNSVFFGVFISLFSYGIGMFLKRKFHSGLFNPLLIAIILTIGFLLVLKVDYDIYYEGAKYLSYLLTPATICLAVPLYEQFSLLKKNYKAILCGIFSGMLSSLTTILVLAWLFHFDYASYATLLPKSITTAIGIGVSEELGGFVSITAAVIILTGVVGNVIAENVLRIMHITHPIAKGVAIGSSAHAIGTAKAMEMGQIEGAMSSLSLVVSGLLTVIFAPIFAGFL